MRQDAGIEGLLSTVYLQLGETCRQLGDLEKARSPAEEGLRMAEKNNERPYEGMARLSLERILGQLETPDIRKAEEFILQGIRLADELKMKPYCARAHFYLGELYVRAGQKEKVLERLTKAEAIFLEMGMEYWLGEVRRISPGL